MHATCTRTIQFVPIHLKPTYINVNSYKFDCLNEKCPVKVFRQSIKWCGPKQKFTYEIKCLIFAISLFLSDETTSKILKLIGINVSNDTVRRLYQSIEIKDEADVLNAKAIIAQSWSAALFEDGTLFIEGALPGKHILREGKPVAVRLPKLPAGFKYSDFVITGSTLYAFWEETNFYTTARSGILEVNLDKSLYSKLL